MAKHIPGSPSLAKIASAKKAISERFANIEAALSDLSPKVFGIQKSSEFSREAPATKRYCNRVMQLFLLISHMRDDVLRLSKRCDNPKQRVHDFISASTANSIIVRAGDAAKHGLGGQSRNATILNGVMIVQKFANKDGTPFDRDECLVVAANVIDSIEGVFSSSVLIESSLRDWVHFLKSQFDLDFSDWLQRCFPATDQPVVRLQHGGHAVVPLGAKLVLDIPDAINQQLVDDVVRRADQA